MGKSSSKQGKPQKNFQWHYNNCTDEDFVQTKRMKEAAPWENDMLVCDQCNVWIAGAEAADSFRYCAKCMGSGHRLHVCKACWKQNRPGVKPPPQVRLDDRAVAEREADKFWSEHFFHYETPEETGARSWQLPGAVHDEGSGQMYNDLIRPPGQRDEDFDEEVQPKTPKTPKTPKMPVSPASSRKSRHSIPTGSLARVGRRVSLINLNDLDEQQEVPQDPLSPTSSNPLSPCVASRTSLFSNVSAGPAMAWMAARQPAADEKQVPLSGIWSGAFIKKKGAKAEHVRRDLKFHEDGTVSGSSTRDEPGVFIEGKVGLNTGKVLWTEVQPAGKSKVAGTIRFGDGCCILRGSITTSKTCGYIELSITAGSSL
jgi:hypothetical protein